jgi:hypothetical protein
MSVCVADDPAVYGKPTLRAPNVSGATSLGESYPNELRYWEARGVSFTGEGWTNERMQTQLTALDLSADSLGSYELTQRDLGLDKPGGLTFQGSNSTSSCPQDTSHPGCYNSESNTIKLLWGNLSAPGVEDDYLSMVVTGVHEMGHDIGYQAGVRFGHSDDYSNHEWAQNVPGWSNTSGSWVYTGSGEVSNYARNNPAEDLAETWTWYVNNQEHFYPFNAYDDPSQARFDALKVAIYGP